MDLDGTLIDADERLSPVVIEAVRAATCVVPVAIASGREPDDVVRFARKLGLEGPQISDNGARVVDPIAGRTLVEMPLDPGVARRIIDDLEERELRFFAVDDGRMARSRAEIRRWRVTIIAAHTITRAAARELAGAYRNVPDVSATPSMDGGGTRSYINFNPAGVNKGRGLVRYARMVDIDPAGVVAVGDSGNDIDMFEAAGTGVAMGNARDDVKRAADHVVSSVARDGLAEAIRRFVLRSDDNR